MGPTTPGTSWPGNPRRSRGRAHPSLIARRPRPPGRLRARRTRGRLFLIAALLALGGAALLIASAFQPTWTFSAVEPSGASPLDQTLAFYPGGSFTQTCEAYCPSPGSSISVAYTAWGLNGTGALYSAYEGVWVALGTLCVLPALFVGLAARPSRRHQYQHRRLLWAMRLAGIAPLIALGVLMAVQPGVIGADSGAVTSVHWSGVSPSPSQSFAGSCAGSQGADGSCPAGESQNWGPGAGFYLALAAGLLVLLGSVFVGLGRRALRDLGGMAPGPMSPTGGTPGTRVPEIPAPGELRPPPPGVPGPPLRGLPPGVCARCAAFTPPPATYCRLCGNRLASP